MLSGILLYFYYTRHQLISGQSIFVNPSFSLKYTGDIGKH
ncbi:hypothetical protein M2480_001182 [Parabacteroides sp. PFB2-12]|nr:hypothetical protein [Parabacteroides sp. PM6-13]MDH6390212.1 hypothetical protein [Parabacteroides sp. PFB2-12]